MKQFLLIILFSMVGVCTFSQKVSSTDFTYPMKPGDDKWEKMSSVEERIASLQIPENILTEISTERLLDICLDYPYLLDVMFYDDFQKGIEALRSNFNGFNELLSRKDLGKFVLAKDKNFPLELDKIKGQNEIEKGKFSFQCFVLDLILAQDNVLGSLSSNEEKELLDITIQNMELKTQQTDIFSSMSMLPSYLLYTKKTLIASNPTYNITTTVKTPNGSTVPDTWILASSDVTTSTAEIAYWKEYLRTNFNGATLIEAPSYKYNCHAYAWHVCEGGDKAWIGRYDTTAENVYWTDGSYVEVPESEATKVSYHESGNHSAIRLSNEWYQSKWGRGPLVKHHLNDVPIDYNPGMTKKFYKRNLPNMYIAGQTYICSSAEYSVSNLPAEATVNWTYTPIHTSVTPHIQQNTPSSNSCTVNNYREIFGGYLNAEIIISGKIQKTISKLIRGDRELFVGFYWQAFSDGSWGPDMSISLEEPNTAIPPYDVIIESDNFIGKRIALSTSEWTTTLTFSASNRVCFEMPNLPSGELLTVRVDGSDCSRPITFTFEAQPPIKSLNEIGLNITPLDANRYNISVDRSENTGKLADGSGCTLLNATEVPKWNLEVHDVMNNQKIMEQSVVGDSYILDLSALNPGIYAVRAIIGDKVATRKIHKN